MPLTHFRFNASNTWYTCVWGNSLSIVQNSIFSNFPLTFFLKSLSDRKGSCFSLGMTLLQLTCMIAIAQALFPELPGIGFAIGSLLGCSVAVVYNIGKKKLISFCVDTGFTCFGLVEQNYELPEEVLHEMGIETIPVPRTQVERIDVPRTQVMETSIEQSEYETIDITVLRRGVIGVNKVGYVFA